MEDPKLREVRVPGIFRLQVEITVVVFPSDSRQPTTEYRSIWPVTYRSYVMTFVASCNRLGNIISKSAGMWIRIEESYVNLRFLSFLRTMENYCSTRKRYDFRIPGNVHTIHRCTVRVKNIRVTINFERMSWQINFSYC